MIDLLSDEEGGLSCRTKLNAAIGVLNSLPAAQTLPGNIKWLNIRDYGATGDGVTDDSAAIASAISASNAFKTASTPGITPIIFAPSGIYLLKNTTLPIFWGGGAIIGEGQDKTMFQLDPAYNGDVFSWSEAWYGGNFFNGANSATKPTGSAEEVTLGPLARDFSIFGDQSSPNMQVALGLYDRCDNVMFSDISVHWCKRGLYIGGPKVQVQSYNRESHYRNLKFWKCGTATLPAVEITSTWNGAGDTTNQLCFYDLNIFGAKSVGLWLRGNPPATCRLIRFFGLRIENAGSDDLGDQLMIGDPTMTGYIRDVYIHGLIMINGGATHANIRLTADSGANMPYLIGIHGGNIGGNGVGIAVDYGRNLAFEVEMIGTTGLAYTIGSNVSPPIYINGYGNEPFWTKSVAGANQQGALRYPNHGMNETSATFDPASLADGAGVTQVVSAPGARNGDFVLVSFSNDLQGITLTAYATTNQVWCRFQNETGAPIDLASGTLRVRVIRNNV